MPHRKMIKFTGYIVRFFQEYVFADGKKIFTPETEFHLEWFEERQRPVTISDGNNRLEKIGTIIKAWVDDTGLYAEWEIYSDKMPRDDHILFPNSFSHLMKWDDKGVVTQCPLIEGTILKWNKEIGYFPVRWE